ncbi:MAG: hypothetical protein ABFS38_20800 [Bacteroidota bacterium]
MKQTIFIFMTLCLFTCKPPQNILDGSDAQFIFRATVESVGAANLPEISDVSNCIVVKVNEVISAPPGFSDWTGKSITVAVKESGRKEPGQEQVFYTNGWLYGKSIAVLEVTSKDSREVTNQQILDGVTRYQDNEVRERLKTSELVISGQVIRIGETIQPKTISEHDPLWTEAIIQIESVEKGEVQSSELKFLFASSGDIMWEGSPKFKEGDTGIWLFRPQDQDQEKRLRISQKEDFYPIERLEYIRSLLK